MVLKLSAIEKKISAHFTLSIDRMSMTSRNIYGIVGNNGAGKTTLLSLLCGLRRPDSGTLRIEGQKLTRDNLDWWKSQLGVYLDESFMFDYYTVFEHFEFMAAVWKVDGVDFKYRLDKYENVFNLKQYYRQRISSLSAGNKKKTGLMGTLLVNPKVIIWDEPFSGLDPRSQDLLMDLLQSYKLEQQAMVIISSHDLNHVAELCDEVVILDHGKIVGQTDTPMSYEQLRETFIVATADSENCAESLE